MNLLAFGLRAFLSLGDESSRLGRAKLRARRTFFQHLQAVTTCCHFEIWAGLMDFMMQGLEIGPYAAQKKADRVPDASPHARVACGQGLYRSRPIAAPRSQSPAPNPLSARAPRSASPHRANCWPD